MKASSLTKILLIVFIVIAIFNFITLFMYTSYNNKFQIAIQNQAIYKQLGFDLMGASDFLTEQARNYVQYGEKIYYDAYMNEVYNTKSRENVIEKLKELGVPQNELDLVMEAARLSSTLEHLEMEAFKAVAGNNFDEAHRLMFGERYTKGKQLIVDTMNMFQKAMNQRAENEARNAREAANLALTVTAFLIMVSVLSAILSLFFILKYIYMDEALRKEHEKQQKKFENELQETALAAQEASRLKSVFLANMSHEIRTPMNGIIGFSELALDSSVPLEDKNDYLRKIKDSGEGLLHIINDILDISKIEAGKIELENIPFNMHEVFRICQTIIMPKALEKGITVYCYAEPSIGKKLMGDPTRMRQVLLNLLSNAVKFTHTGTVKLLSAIKAAGEDSVTIYFEVKDSGIGMTQEQIEKIFVPFMQADSTTTRKYGGTGLGLSIAQNIIELMGGEIKVESTLGIGSKFSFELTFQTVEVLSDSFNDKIKINEFRKPIFRGEILLCEDNEINQQVIRDHLARIGFDTVIAENGQAGVELVSRRMKYGEKPFDLIFMDIHMPVMDGLEAAREIAGIGSQTPIVALTANVMETDKEIYRLHGMPDYLAKPFRTNDLLTCLFKYFTPVDMKSVNISEESDRNDKQRIGLIKNFVKDNRNTFEDIVAAIEAKDIKLAHRSAHTLKGVAGLIGKTALQEAARNVECSLEDEKAEIAKEQMDALKYELNRALNESALLLEESIQTPHLEHFNKEDALAMLDELELLLADNNTECIEWVVKLKGIPETEILIEHIETFEFKQASEAIMKVKRDLAGIQ